MASRSEQKQTTRQRILDAALIVFGSRGLVATPVSAVARQAGLAHGSVFVHFGSQEGLISAVVEDFGLALAGELHRLTEAGAGPRQVLEAHLRGLRQHEAFYTRLVAEGPVLPVLVRQTLAGIQSAVAFHLVPAFGRATLQGALKPVPPAFLFNTWIGLVHHHLINQDLFAPGGSVIDRCGPALIQDFLSLIETSPGGKV